MSLGTFTSIDGFGRFSCVRTYFHDSLVKCRGDLCAKFSISLSNDWLNLLTPSSSTWGVTLVDADSQFRQAFEQRVGFLGMTASLVAAYTLPRLLAEKLYNHPNKQPATAPSTSPSIVPITTSPNVREA